MVDNLDTKVKDKKSIGVLTPAQLAWCIEKIPGFSDMLESAREVKAKAREYREKFLKDKTNA